MRLQSPFGLLSCIAQCQLGPLLHRAKFEMENINSYITCRPLVALYWASISNHLEFQNLVYIKEIGKTQSAVSATPMVYALLWPLLCHILTSSLSAVLFVLPPKRY